MPSSSAISCTDNPPWCSAIFNRQPSVNAGTVVSVVTPAVCDSWPPFVNRSGDTPRDS